MSAPPIELPIALKEEIREFYADYATVLDDEEFERWPDFFSDDCVYQVIPAENYARGLQLCTIQADSKGMLLDRVQGILRTQKFVPRRCRRFYSALKVGKSEGGLVPARQNVLMVQTLLDEPSTILLCGRALDSLIHSDGRWRFQRRVVVCDTEILQEALIYPI
jgi:salicylate 5-hydroxylase small subunit